MSDAKTQEYVPTFEQEKLQTRLTRQVPEHARPTHAGRLAHLEALVSCLTPLHGFRAPGGQIKFTRNGAWSDRPVTVGCGQCIGCRLDRSRGWAIRCMHEAQMHETSSFVTLTYDDEHLPPDNGLDVEHWQEFAQRFRDQLGKFRYFHCGEYGDNNRRPHYHAAIFGHDFRSDRDMLRTTPHELWTSPSLEALWGKGYVTVGNLTVESAAYVARYVTKKLTGEAGNNHYQWVDPATGESRALKPPYATMSRRPGLGSKWLEKYHGDVYPDDFVVTSDGKKMRTPKFYDDWYEKRFPAEMEAVKRARAARGKSHEENNTPDRLHTRRQYEELKQEFYSQRNL